MYLHVYDCTLYVYMYAYTDTCKVRKYIQMYSVKILTLNIYTCPHISVYADCTFPVFSAQCEDFLTACMTFFHSHMHVLSSTPFCIELHTFLNILLHA